jgi:hypothetical protein
MLISADEMARKANEMQEDVILQHIFSTLEGKYISEWRSTPPAELQKREAAYAAIRALEDIKGKIGSLANAPRVDAHNNRNVARR